ncbi:hypothetical protein ID388_005014 [Escherichia coli]|uniref:hypothetical protein n=1 Tax=Escherichia coli TaxID=562 RepID=UPI000543C6D5|nr:hypothetical protein [Escherichia coli]EEU9452352.1 hypothetical protein [Escherichia coli]EEV6048386.1 hypothetical protein [Escherichia coli]EEW1020531.1 hypothetical protein [Escherichia coli]EFO0452271.1 hypothetical protein [Escherichia coli]EFO2305621.1 hypothetical protein [Escherichia coli]
MSDDKKIEFSTSDVLNALLHRQQNMHHLATQESVDNLRRDIDSRFNSSQENVDSLRREIDGRFNSSQDNVDNLRREVDSRFNSLQNQLVSVDKRLDKLETKFDRLQWFIVAAALALIFKDYIFRFMGTL